MNQSAALRRSCRRFATLVFGLGLAAGQTSLHAGEASYPSKAISVIIPVAAGGWQDTTSRLFAQKIAANLNATVIIENRPSAGSVVGTQYVARSAADGYTLLAVSDTFVITPALNKNAGYDPRTDFAGIGQMARSPIVIVVGASSTIKTIADLLAQAKAKPGSFAYASGGTGSTSHMVAEAFAAEAGLSLLHIPYKGNAPAIPDVVSGRVEFIMSPISSAIPLIKAGQLRPIAMTSANRSSFLPGVPALRESGYPDFDGSVFSGLLAPIGTPVAVLERLRGALESAKANADLVATVKGRGDEVGPNQSVEQFNAFLATEVTRYVKLVKDKGIKSE